MKLKNFTFEKDNSGITGFVNGSISMRNNSSTLKIEHLNGYNVSMTAELSGEFLNGVSSRGGRCYINIMTRNFTSSVDIEALELIQSHENDCKEISSFLEQIGKKNLDSHQDEKDIGKEEQEINEQRERERQEREIERQQREQERQQRAFERQQIEQIRRMEQQSSRVQHASSSGLHSSHGLFANHTITAEQVTDWVFNKLIPNARLKVSFATTFVSQNGIIDFKIQSLTGTDTNNIKHTYTNIRVRQDATKPLADDALTYDEHFTTEASIANRARL